MEGWDLQAIVRGGMGSEASANIMDNDPTSVFAPLSMEQDDFIFSFPEIFESTAFLDELDELYKPFYPVVQPLSSPETIFSSSSILSELPVEVKEPQELQNQQIRNESANGETTSTTAAKPKRSRKNQQKRVVKEVAANEVSTDKWAWRKYGQKPIKGSPYPRSYYRCSSLKGCLARKQVERSSSDPQIFIVTYTADHSHAHPTRRNSLAGSTRSKASIPKEPPSVKGSDCSPATTPSMASTSTKKEEERTFEDSESKEMIIVPDIISSDELYPSLEDLGGIFLDQFADTYNIG